jgi:hypothetical protein
MDVTEYTTNISDQFHEFSAALAADSPVPVHSVAVIGSALTPDFVPGQSDINSIVVVENVTVEFLDFIVLLGKKYSSHFIAAPMLLTPHYIATSLDVFPIEFFNLQAIHHTVSGTDPLADLIIKNSHLRLQCEREVKSKLLWLHQGYISALGNEEQLVRQLRDSITGYLPLFRAILFLAGHELTLSGHDTAATVQEALGLDSKIFTTILELKKNGRTSKADELCDCFSDYYHATRQLSDYVDTLPV